MYIERKVGYPVYTGSIEHQSICVKPQSTDCFSGLLIKFEKFELSLPKIICSLYLNKAKYYREKIVTVHTSGSQWSGKSKCELEQVLCVTKFIIFILGHIKSSSQDQKHKIIFLHH